MRDAVQHAMQDATSHAAPDVLIASRDWALRELLRLLMEDRGYDVVVAADNADALELIEQAERPLIVVLDLTPEDTTTLDVLRTAARDPAHCFRPAYVLLAPAHQGLPCDVWPLIEALAIPVLCKPLDLDELFEIVDLLSHCLCSSSANSDLLSL